MSKVSISQEGRGAIIIHLNLPDRLVLRASVLDELDTAALALLDGWHVPGVGSEHEGVSAPWICVGVTGETVNLLPS